MLNADGATHFHFVRPFYRWKNLADQTKPKRLVLTHPNYNRKPLWDLNYRPIDDDVFNRIYFGQCFKVLPLNLKHVKCLIINTPLFYEDAKVFNQFQQLEHLEFHSLIWEQVCPPQIILPNLKILRIESAAYNHGGCTIDAPKLETVSCNKGLDGIKFLHSKSVRHLEIGDIQSDLKKFVNVEVFSCFNLDSLIFDLLRQLPKLKEIHLVNDHYKDIYVKNLDFDKAKAKMQWQIECKKFLMKTELKLYFLGELLNDDAKTFEDYNFKETFKHIFNDSN